MIKRSKGKSKDKVKVTFVIDHNPDQPTVSVVGDFNGWDPSKNKLIKRRNGTRSAAVELGKGQTYRFRYYAADGSWFNDENADAYAPGDHGSEDCLLNL
jgi:1,4-alpha-glucan branching enzyme